MRSQTEIDATRCSKPLRKRFAADIPLAVLPARPTAVRPSTNARKRAIVLLAVHLFIIAHVLHWIIAGRTLSPVEPSEAMYTLNHGHLNAGFVFFALAILATLLLGRFLCGWGCHLVAYQDLCAWLLRKVGVKVKPFRSRILVFAPLALAIYMFVWPTAYRIYRGIPAPDVTNHVTTAEFWKTFPGLTMAIVTIAVCGFGIIYILGGKGFCTYACPYGGFFGLADQVAPGRIRVTDDCEHCGHCTAVCTSNVRVHEEVARFGMVVDPGCMKCMDCVSVCPNDALYFGFTAPPLLHRKAPPNHSPDHQFTKSPLRRFDFSLPEELLMIAVGLVSLLAYRGLYGQIPLLLAMGMAAITAFLTIKFTHLFRSANVRFQNLQFKRGGRITTSGWSFAGATLLLLAFTVHGFFLQYHHWRGSRLFAAAKIGDEVWLPGDAWWTSATPDRRAAVESAIAHLQRVDDWGLLPTPPALQDLVWLHLARGDAARAERAVRRLIQALPNEPDAHRGLGGVLRKSGRYAESETAYRRAVELDPSSAARRDLAALLIEQRRFDDALTLYRQAPDATKPGAGWRLDVAKTLMAAGRFAEAASELRAILDDEGESPVVLASLGVAELQTGGVDAGIARLRRALALDESLAEARYNLALALLMTRDIDESISHFERVIAEKPAMPEAHYNLGVALFMSGRPADALPRVREALRLAPDDEQARQFLDVVLRNLANGTLGNDERPTPNP